MDKYVCKKCGVVISQKRRTRHKERNRCEEQHIRKKNNKKGLGKISIIFFSLVFVILWALFFAAQLSFWGHQAVINGNLSGIEAFFYDNINLVVGVIFSIFILAVASFYGEN
jgi:hypothetical protein